MNMTVESTVVFTSEELDKMVARIQRRAKIKKIVKHVAIQSTIVLTTVGATILINSHNNETEEN